MHPSWFLEQHRQIGNPGSVNAALQQIQVRGQQPTVIGLFCISYALVFLSLYIAAWLI